jgi:hypothetical protein
MPKKNAAMKTKLPIRVRNLNVYLSESDELLSLGANGAEMTPVNFLLTDAYFPTKALRRKFRKQLHKIDPGLAAASVPSKPLADRVVMKRLADYRAKREAEIAAFNRNRYRDADIYGDENR